MPKYQFDESKPIKVYFNLHKKQFSVMQGGLVVQHLFYLDMQDVTFHVQPAGNAKVRREKKKNVHAYVKGMLAPDYRTRNLTRIGYITSAEWVSLDCNCRLLAEDRKPYMKVRKKNY